MVDIASILALSGASLSTLNSAADLSKKLKESFGSNEPDLTAVKEHILDLLSRLIEAQSTQVEMQRLLAELEKKLQKSDRFAQKATHYEFATTELGGSVYALKRNNAPGGLPDELCAQCFEAEEIGILQLTDQPNTFVCQRCQGKVLKPDGRDWSISVSSARTD